MAANPFVPNGLSVARSRAGGSATYQNNISTIKAGYATAIGRGDLINRGTGTYAGYAVLSGVADTTTLGVYVSCYPYYDNTAMQTMHGLIGAWPANANPSADVPIGIIDDPFVTFHAQVYNATFSQSWVGQNINFLAGSNGAPNATGQSTLALDPTTIGPTNTLPFQILGVLGTVGGPQDPTQLNPWIEVRLNTAALLNTTGR